MLKILIIDHLKKTRELSCLLIIKIIAMWCMNSREVNLNWAMTNYNIDNSKIMMEWIMNINVDWIRMVVVMLEMVITTIMLLCVIEKCHLITRTNSKEKNSKIITINNNTINDQKVQINNSKIKKFKLKV